MASEDNLDSLAPDSEKILRIAKGQTSYNGLHVLSGIIMEECNRDLQWPQCMITYKNMCKDSTIAPALTLMELAIARTQWTVKIPEGYEERLKPKADFLMSIMNDMEHTWTDFVRQASTFNRFGFAPVEKVYRKRTKANGSKFNDNLIGIRKLPLIAQDSVSGWYWDDSGRTLKGLVQQANVPSGRNRFAINVVSMQEVEIPRKKFILFRADPLKDSPIGTSPLNSVYLSWRYKTELEKHQAISVANDLRGLKVIKIPPRYLSADATEEEKETAEYFRKILRGMHSGSQSGLLIPAAYDETGKELFSFEVKSVMGQVANDVSAIINSYRKEIITGIMAPQLILGQDGGGSFALSESLQGVTDIVIQARLQEIKDQLNHDLIPQLFELNGWDSTVTPYFDFVDNRAVNLDNLSKFIQRVGAVGGLVLNAETINWLHEQADMPLPFDDTNISIEEVREMSTMPSSNSGEGMEPGTTGNGTAKRSSSRDNSTANSSN